MNRIGLRDMRKLFVELGTLGTCRELIRVQLRGD